MYTYAYECRDLASHGHVNGVRQGPTAATYAKLKKRSLRILNQRFRHQSSVSQEIQSLLDQGKVQEAIWQLRDTKQYDVANRFNRYIEEVFAQGDVVTRNPLVPALPTPF